MARLSFYIPGMNEQMNGLISGESIIGLETLHGLQFFAIPNCRTINELPLLSAEPFTIKDDPHLLLLAGKTVNFFIIGRQTGMGHLRVKFEILENYSLAYSQLKIAECLGSFSGAMGIAYSVVRYAFLHPQERLEYEELLGFKNPGADKSMFRIQK